jgi:hypothetical protein
MRVDSRVWGSRWLRRPLFAGAGSIPACAGTLKHHRVLRDFEQRTDAAETFVLIAASATMLRRIP